MRPSRYRSSQHLPSQSARLHDMAILMDLYDLERLRQVVRRELKVHTGQRTLAQEIGISRGSLRKLLEMQSVPTHHNLERLKEWATDRPEVWTPLGALALAVLVMDLPAEMRADLRRQVACLVESAYFRLGQSPPDWLARECGYADPGGTDTGASRGTVSPVER